MKQKSVSPEKTISVHVPMTFAIRGGRKTIITDKAPAPPQPRVDNALLKALARAHRWRQLVENGTFSSITELAKAEGVNQSYACRLFRLTLLAPHIVTAIIDGQPAPGLMLKSILKPLPSNWDEQTILWNKYPTPPVPDGDGAPKHSSGIEQARVRTPIRN